MLLVMQQHISSDVVLARDVMHFQIQLSQTLQPMGLENVEVGLNKYVYYEWLMISMQVTYSAC